MRRGLLHGIVCLGYLAAREVRAADTIKVPLMMEHWRIAAPTAGEPKPDVQFARHEGFPEGVLVLKSGTAVLNGLNFRDGTIEFDMKGLGEDIPGIQFRQQGLSEADNAEEFYVRTFPECRASNDCIQYAPVIHGFLLWNAYPQYQTQAFILDGWNHMKLVISGRRMNVYINRFPNPALVVGSLEGSTSEGAIALRGPATYANLTVIADAVEGLSPTATPDPTASDPGFVRQWQLGPLTPRSHGNSPSYADLPGVQQGWARLTAGRFGMVNLNRKFTFDDQPPKVTWMRSNVTSDREQEKRVSLGWLGQVWVFVNGRLITQGKNFYDPEFERRDPDGRLSLENGSFAVPLHRGENEIVIALVAGVHDSQIPNRYGWGLAMRFDDVSGLKMDK